MNDFDQKIYANLKKLSTDTRIITYDHCIILCKLAIEEKESLQSLLRDLEQAKQNVVERT